MHQPLLSIWIVTISYRLNIITASILARDLIKEAFLRAPILFLNFFHKVNRHRDNSDFVSIQRLQNNIYMQNTKFSNFFYIYKKFLQNVYYSSIGTKILSIMGFHPLINLSPHCRLENEIYLPIIIFKECILYFALYNGKYKKFI